MQRRMCSRLIDCDLLIPLDKFSPPIHKLNKTSDGYLAGPWVTDRHLFMKWICIYFCCSFLFKLQPLFLGGLFISHFATISGFFLGRCSLFGFVLQIIFEAASLLFRASCSASVVSLQLRGDS